MRGVRRNQRDLFDEAAPVAELQLDLRRKLTPLLRVLLTEAAGVEARRSESADRASKEAGDDEDHT